MRNNKLKIIVTFSFLIVITILVVWTIFQEDPVKRAVTLNTSNVNYSKVSTGKVELVVGYTQSTDPRWAVIGVNGSKFDEQGIEPYEYIAVEGNDPANELNEEILLYSEHTPVFILRGQLREEDNPNKLDLKALKVLTVESWDIVEPISRGNKFFRPLSSSKYLSRLDFVK